MSGAVQGAEEQGTQGRQAADLAGRVLLKIAVIQTQALKGGDGGNGGHGPAPPVKMAPVHIQVLQGQGLHCYTGGVCGDTHKAVDM